MNQRGEATLLTVCCMVAITGLLTLSILKLQRSFDLMQRRTRLFLCVKETKGELHRYLRFMGRTNWAISNAKKAGLLMAFIPGLQGGAMKAHKVKKILIQLQNTSLVAYLKKLKDLESKGCPLDPRMVITPFALSAVGHERDAQDRAKLRKKKWEYYFVKLPYHLKLEVNASGIEAVTPVLHYHSSEKMEKLSSLWFSPY